MKAPPLQLLLMFESQPFWTHCSKVYRDNDRIVSHERLCEMGRTVCHLTFRCVDASPSVALRGFTRAATLIEVVFA